MSDLLLPILCIVAFVATACICKWLGLPEDKVASFASATEAIISAAEAGVRYAKQYKKDLSGVEKMEYVVEMIKDSIKNLNIKLSDDQIRAYVQQAYDNMKLEDNSLITEEQVEAIVVKVIGNLLGDEDDIEDDDSDEVPTSDEVNTNDSDE